MQIFVHGNKQEGFYILRTLLAVFSILMCLTSIIGILYTISRMSNDINVDVNSIINTQNNIVYETLYQ
ncbi:MAG: hypothetical protein IJD23_01345 [Spirochaetaceae bacterium]|nr:hypothetical protein [Spirochaetaceae bacterium]